MATRASENMAEKSVNTPSGMAQEIEISATTAPAACEEKFHWSQLDKSVIPVSLGLLFAWTAQQQIPTVINPILGPINAAVGPSNTFTWMASAYNMATAITWCFVGPLSDALGRRWLFLSGGIIGLVGGIVAGTAKTVNTVIVGMTLLGAAAATQQVSGAATAEIFPMKWRGYVQAAIEAMPFAFNTFGSLIGHSMVETSSWRWGFYINIIITACSVTFLFFWYHPPVPQKELSRFDILKTLDFVGCGLFMAGLAGFLLGLTWAAGTYPWKSAPVLVTMILGILLLVAFGFWEAYGSKNPLFPGRLFTRKTGMTSLVIVVFVGSLPLYAMLSGWAQEVSILYTQDPIKIGVYGIPQGVGLEFGAIIAGFLLKLLGHTDLQLMGSAFTETLFVGLMAVLTPNSVVPAFPFLLIGCLAMNYLQITAMVMAQLGVDHRDLAKATGLLAIARNAGGAIATAMFFSILRSRVSSELPRRVTSAVLDLGLPESSLPVVLQGAASFNETMITSAPGVTSTIAKAAGYAVKLAYASSFRAIYYVGVGLGVVSVAAAWFTSDVTPLMTDHVQVDLHEKDHARLFKPVKIVEGPVASQV